MGIMKEMLTTAHQEATDLRDRGRNDCLTAAQYRCMLWILSRGIRACDFQSRLAANIRNKYNRVRGR